MFVRCVALLFSPLLTLRAHAQDSTRARVATSIDGAISITNKGISVIPSFTLGKPAGQLNLAVRHGALSFEPEFRFGLNAKPWSFLFWGRYQLVRGERLHIQIGAHPALNFRAQEITIGGALQSGIVARRYVAAEVAPSYRLTPHVTVGSYYLASHGFDPGTVRTTNFVSARVNLSSLRLSEWYTLNLAPQFYYLKTDAQDGWYVNSGATVSRTGAPFALSATANKPLRSTIAGGREFLWNVTLTYTIHPAR
jgi:hypothetical protein